MMINYNKQQILDTLESGYSQLFEEIREKMRNQIADGNEIRIITQLPECPIEDVITLTSIEDVNKWFEQYGF